MHITRGLGFTLYISTELRGVNEMTAMLVDICRRAVIWWWKRMKHSRDGISKGVFFMALILPKGIRLLEPNDEQRVTRLSDGVQNWLRENSESRFFLGAPNIENGVCYDPYENGDVLGVGAIFDKREKLLKQFNNELGYDYRPGESGSLVFFVHPEFHGKGVGTSLVKSTSELARHLDMKRMFGICNVGNHASEKSMRKGGYQTLHDDVTLYPDDISVWKHHKVLWTPTDAKNSVINADTDLEMQSE